MRQDKINPIKKRDLALEHIKEGCVFFNRDDYEKALKEFRISISILYEITKDKDNLDKYDLSFLNPSINKKEFLEVVYTEILKDLSFSNREIGQCLYFLNKSDESLKYFRRSYDYIKEYNRREESQDSLLDLITVVLYNVIFSYYSSNVKVMTKYLDLFFNYIKEYFKNGEQINQDLKEVLELCLKIAIDYVKNNVEIGDKFTEEFTKTIQELKEEKRPDIYLIGKDKILELLKFSLKNNLSWSYDNYSFDIIALRYLNNCLDILYYIDENDKFIEFSKEIESLSKLINTPNLVTDYIKILKNIRDFYRDHEEYEKASVLIKRIIKFREEYSYLFTPYQIVIDYDMLIVLLTESGQIKEAEYLYEKYNDMIDALNWDKRYLEITDLKESEFDYEKTFLKAELYLNIALNSFREENKQKAEKYYNKAIEMLDKLNNRFYHKHRVEILKKRLDLLKIRLETTK